ncbi:BIG1 [[Candida] subhashii]|uniref:Protein BIG1 n=1 Tax=[Candida] subhashii TaxID=561895 RepID=A0A8J5QNL7_9ASCO|nr:BIG1 [[Candida] subhashii]KAG7663638.1 BIG1 [[Candida] subhashii]
MKKTSIVTLLAFILPFISAQPHNITSVTNLIKREITQCSSDVYLIINQPGLTYQDLTSFEKDNWYFLRKYTYMASTGIGIPRIEGTLDLDYIENYIIKTCEAEVINVFHESEDEVVDYFDTRKRVIRVDLGDLPTEGRGHEIQKHDELLRKIMRKVPSPHYTIILTSTEPGITHPVPAIHMEQSPDRFEIFYDIFSDPKNSGEFEKNDRFHSVEPDWNNARHSNDRYIQNKKKDEIHLFDYELWTKNEKLITTIFVMIVSLFMMKTLSFLNNLKKRIMERKLNKKRVILPTDKMKTY